MFKFESPVFVHKNILKKEMLDELRDYPLQISRMMLEGCGDGVLKGTEITWEDHVLSVNPGLILHGGNLYRMEEAFRIDCPASDQLTYIKVRFITMDYEKDRIGGLGDVYMDEIPPENGEIELGRFQLQEGARLRTTYENFEDYQTEFDTVNRIHMPFIGEGSPGLWAELLMEFAYELLKTGTDNLYDTCFAMQILGAKGKIARELTAWYVEKSMGRKVTDFSNGFMYEKLRGILKERQNGNSDFDRKQGHTRQMLLL